MILPCFVGLSVCLSSSLKCSEEGFLETFDIGAISSWLDFSWLAIGEILYCCALWPPYLLFLWYYSCSVLGCANSSKPNCTGINVFPDVMGFHGRNKYIYILHCRYFLSAIAEHLVCCWPLSECLYLLMAGSMSRRSLLQTCAKLVTVAKEKSQKKWRRWCFNTSAEVVWHLVIEVSTSPQCTSVTVSLYLSPFLTVSNQSRSISS